MGHAIKLTKSCSEDSPDRTRPYTSNIQPRHSRYPERQQHHQLQYRWSSLHLVGGYVGSTTGEAGITRPPSIKIRRCSTAMHRLSDIRSYVLPCRDRRRHDICLPPLRTSWCKSRHRLPCLILRTRSSSHVSRFPPSKRTGGSR